MRVENRAFLAAKKKKNPCEILYGLICSMLEDFRVFKCYLLTQKCERKKAVLLAVCVRCYLSKCLGFTTRFIQFKLVF